MSTGKVKEKIIFASTIKNNAKHEVKKNPQIFFFFGNNETWYVRIVHLQNVSI